MRDRPIRQDKGNRSDASSERYSLPPPLPNPSPNENTHQGWNFITVLPYSDLPSTGRYNCRYERMRRECKRMWGETKCASLHVCHSFCPTSLGRRRRPKKGPVKVRGKISSRRGCTAAQRWPELNSGFTPRATRPSNT